MKDKVYKEQTFDSEGTCCYHHVLNQNRLWISVSPQQRRKGCKVWDLDGKEYTDVSISAMGIGTNTLGYGHEEVDDAVFRVVRDGNMSTFCCPEEVELAEKLIELNPWAGMVRFSRSGGEVNSIAIRIAVLPVERIKLLFVAIMAGMTGICR